MFKLKICHVEMINFLTRKWQVCYSSQHTLENSTANLSAFYNSCAQIACFYRLSCSCTFLYAGSSVQNAIEQFVSCIHIFCKLRSVSNRTNKNQTALGLEVQRAVSRKPFRNRHLFIRTFSSQRPVLSLPIILTFPPVSPCVT
jgi:hypothetical protein